LSCTERLVPHSMVWSWAPKRNKLPRSPLAYNNGRRTIASQRNEVMGQERTFDMANNAMKQAWRPPSLRNGYGGCETFQTAFYGIRPRRPRQFVGMSALGQARRFRDVCGTSGLPHNRHFRTRSALRIWAKCRHSERKRYRDPSDVEGFWHNLRAGKSIASTTLPHR